MDATAIELSSLRLGELWDLASSFDSLDLSSFLFVSVHLPSRYPPEAEPEVVKAAHSFVQRGAKVVLHPDVICQPQRWRALGDSLLIENMDKRKSMGRTATELMRVFDQLPDAGLCLDVGHVQQVDPSLSEASLLIEKFRDRIQSVHVSHVSSSSAHESVDAGDKGYLPWISKFLPVEVPAISEAPLDGADLAKELRTVLKLMTASEG